MISNEWYGVIGTFGIGDLVTTFTGMLFSGIVEKNPIFESYYTWEYWYLFIVMKINAMIVAYIFYYYTAQNTNLPAKVIPYTLIAIGILVTISNAIVVYTVVS